MTKLTQHRITGLIGMSGAGKSTVCARFAQRGFTVIDCDLSAREVVQKGSPALKELADALSPQLILPDGALDRRLTAEMIFSSDEKRGIFNRIIYPYITYNVICKIKNAGGDVLLDAPTLYEARLEGLCDSIVSVCADRQICVERIMQRDGISRGSAEARLNAQHDIQWYSQRSQFCIVNNGTQQQAFESCDSIISTLKGNP